MLGSLFPNKAVPRSGGWDRTILNGNCVMISLDFWFSSLVQRFVQLCRASGGSVMYRWNEQAVLGMVAQIFASQEQLLMFSFPYAHRCGGGGARRGRCLVELLLLTGWGGVGSR